MQQQQNDVPLLPKAAKSHSSAKIYLNIAKIWVK
jgi:hypothetical protein